MVVGKNYLAALLLAATGVAQAAPMKAIKCHVLLDNTKEQILQLRSRGEPEKLEITLQFKRMAATEQRQILEVFECARADKEFKSKAARKLEGNSPL
ncbi:TapY2 family type IVa secretion system protein [Gallaecimonas sp. GXIMD4217]|uniref:TapY2 family type IVa secretion system protein n=1 Tax=Gallaecimonas sp. GXIMD4217 TaxID=3131927 RepID=UPI00311AC1E3